MPTTSPNYGLALYNNTTDQTQTFASYRDAITGVGASSNMMKIDTALKSQADSITSLGLTKGAVLTAATKDGASHYTATGITAITAYYTGLSIVLIPSGNSDATMALNINALGDKYLMKVNDAGTFINLAANDLIVSHDYLFIYDGTRWLWINAISNDQLHVQSGTSGDAVILDANKALSSTSQSLLISGTTNAAVSKATPIDADALPILDSGTGNILNKVTWLNVKATLKTYFDTLYLALIDGLTAKVTPVDADEMPLADSAATFASRKITWANIKAGLKTYFDTLYVSVSTARREVLTAARTYYVSPTGNDTNNGLSAGAPFLTIQKAVDTVAGLDLSIYDVTIQLADGTYTATTVLKATVGAGAVNIQGNSVTPANVIISTTGADCFNALNGPQSKYIIKDMKLQTTTSGNGILANGSYVQYSNIVFGACATYHIYASRGLGFVGCLGNYSIVGGASAHYFVDNGAQLGCSGFTITVTGTPAFSGAFASCTARSILSAVGSTYSGAATGTRYNATLNSAINTNGGGANVFPGSIAGTTSTGGQYA